MFELAAEDVLGIPVVGWVMKATKECVPAAAVYATEHRLSCAQAPTSVPVVWSKISMADRVPVTLAPAVATRTTLVPARGDT